MVFRQVARHYAARENLQIDFWLEGSVVTNLIVRNLRITPVGPSDIESIEADVVRANYSLFGFLRHGRAELLKDLQVHSARIVMNPDAKPKPPPGAKSRKKNNLPARMFPERIRLADVSLVIRDKPHDFFIQHADMDLNPKSAGKLHIGRIQLTNGQNWTNISGATSYAHKDLFVRDVKLNDQERLNFVNVDASALLADKLDLKFEAKIADGIISSAMEWNKQRSDVFRKIRIHAERIPGEALNKYVTLPGNFLRGDIRKVDIDLTGRENEPGSWNGTADAELQDFYVGAIGFNSWTFDGWVKNGQIGLESADLIRNENHVYLRGSAHLPERFRDLHLTGLSLDINAAIDLGKLTAGMAEPITGSVQGNGKITANNGKLEATLLASGGSIVTKEGTVERALVNISAEKVLPPPGTNKPWFADLKTTSTIDASNVRYQAYVCDSLKSSVKSEGDVLTIEQLNVVREYNNLSARGRYRLPADFHDLKTAAADADVILHATNVGKFWASDSKPAIAGPLEISAQLQWRNQKLSGIVKSYGSDVEMRSLVFSQFSLQSTIADNVFYLNDFTAKLKEPGFIGANGRVELKPPFHYSGKIKADIPNLAALEPMLRASGNKSALAGSLKIDWEGEGESRTLKNSGKLKLALDKGRYGELPVQSNIDATYTRNGLQVPVFFIATDKMNFETIIESGEETLEITKIALNQGEAKYASGYVSIPFTWKNIWKNDPVVPSSGKVIANFQSENIDIDKLFKDFGATAPVGGVFSVKIDAGGPISDLKARLDLQLRDLHTARLPKLQPGVFNLAATVEHDQLKIAGKLEQSKIQPLEMNAQMPFDIPKIVREQKIPGDTPISGKVHMPRSSVNVFRQLVPELEVLDGELAGDVDIGGKFAAPVLSGNADMTVTLARFSNATLPALRDFKARLVFNNDKVTLERFGGELAGGRFTVDGAVTFPTITSANLDLHLKGASMLVARNDTMTARTDADLKVAGPLTSATVTGNVAITNSRFLKNIDLVPIGLPGRPAPQPPASRPDFSIPDPPFRDWKFDVAIKTKDPILLRGNLAVGNAICDMQLKGTGLQPGLSGNIQLKNVDATLPFSRLSISNGFLYFDPSDSLNPKIDFIGTSNIQDYTVRAYVYGTVLDPQAIFTSEPPLPQEEIISLMATGTTRDQLTGDNNVLAGRAATLLVQQLYRKVFKKGDDTESSSNVFDRLDLDVGQVDPRTGQRQATARYRINRQFLLVGDVEVGGDFRVKLRYLIRFR